MRQLFKVGNPVKLSCQIKRYTIIFFGRDNNHFSIDLKQVDKDQILSEVELDKYSTLLAITLGFFGLCLFKLKWLVWDGVMGIKEVDE